MYLLKRSKRIPEVLLALFLRYSHTLTEKINDIIIKIKEGGYDNCSDLDENGMGMETPDSLTIVGSDGTNFDIDLNEYFTTNQLTNDFSDCEGFTGSDEDFESHGYEKVCDDLWKSTE